MLQCPYCYAVNPEESEFCNKCGSSIAESHETLTSPLSLEVTEKGYIYFSPGDLFADRYLIIEEIGRGGMGVVYKAEDRILGISVALKIIHPLYADSPYMVHRFKEEILLARSISHENVIRIHDIGEKDGIKYISMDFIKGQNLRELIRVSGTLTIETASKFTEQICRALQAAHEKGVIHRDLKPQNIMIDSNGKALTMDFGLAKSMVTGDKKYAKKIIGTPAYMSPEQAKGEETDQRSDIYSLGIVLYEMFTGKRPIKADSKEGYIRKHLKEKPEPPRELAPNIPIAIETIILKCLEKNKLKRYQSVQEILNALKPQHGRSIAAVPPKRTPVVRYWYVLPILLVICIGGYLLLREPSLGGEGATDEAGPSLVVELGLKTVAVMKFENNTGDDDLDNWRSALQNWLISDLSQSTYLRVLADDVIDQILIDQGELDAQSYPADTLKKISKVEDIAYFLLGSYASVGDEYWLTIMIRDASQNDLLGSVLVEGQGKESFPNLIDDATLQVKKHLKLSDAEIAADIDADVGVITTQSPEAWQLYNAGYQLTHERKHEESIEYFKKAIELDPEFSMAYKLLSDAFWYTNKLDESRAHLLKAVELLHRASEKERYLIKAQAANRIQNSTEEAIKQYEALLNQYPLDRDGLKFLGSLYRFIEEWDLALICWEKLLNSNKSIDRFLSIENISWIFMTKGWYEKALELILPHKHIYPAITRYHSNIANIYMCTKDYDAALEEALKWREIDPDNRIAIRVVGQIKMLQEEFDEALKHFSLLSERDDLRAKVDGIYWMAFVYLTQGRYSECLQQTELGLRLTNDPKFVSQRGSFHWLRAHIFLGMNELTQAAEATSGIMEYALERKDFTPLMKYALMYRGITQIAASQLEEAEATLGRLKTLVEEDARAQDKRYYDYLAGMLAKEKGQLEEAVVHFRDAYARLPHQLYPSDNHAFFLDALASAYLEKKDFVNALDTYKKITQLSVGRLTWGDVYVRSFYTLGKIYQELGQDKEAEEAYQKFLSLWKDADPDLDELVDAKQKLLNQSPRL